jgi:hypothetical protein
VRRKIIHLSWYFKNGMNAGSFFLLDGLFIEEFKKYFLRSHLLLRILKLRFFYAYNLQKVLVI